jgi:hypothetical protein
VSDSSKKQTDREIGEGDRESARRFNKHAREFVDSTDVEKVAREAEPGSDEEREELREAERKGKSRAKEHDHSESFDSRKPS